MGLRASDLLCPGVFILIIILTINTVINEIIGLAMASTQLTARRIAIIFETLITLHALSLRISIGA